MQDAKFLAFGCESPYTVDAFRERRNRRGNRFTVLGGMTAHQWRFFCSPLRGTCRQHILPYMGGFIGSLALGGNQVPRFSNR